MKNTTRYIPLEFQRYGFCISGDSIRIDTTGRVTTIPDFIYNLKKDIISGRSKMFKYSEDIVESLRSRTNETPCSSRSLLNLFITNLEKFYKFLDSYDIPEFISKANEIRYYLNQDILYFSESNILDFLILKNKFDIIDRSTSIKVYLSRLLESYISNGKYSINLKIASGFQGPWAYFDLPLSHRVVPYGVLEMPELQRQRQKQRRYRSGLSNYNTPDVGEGFYWRSLVDRPFLYSDMDTESPYKTRHYLSR